VRGLFGRSALLAAGVVSAGVSVSASPPLLQAVRENESSASAASITNSFFIFRILLVA
jgi:hypothetical protein